MLCNLQMYVPVVKRRESLEEGQEGLQCYITVVITPTNFRTIYFVNLPCYTAGGSPGNAQIILLIVSAVSNIVLQNNFRKLN